MNRLYWGFLTLLFLGIGTFFLVYPQNLYGGDIIEYFGMTESFLRHATPRLEPADEHALKTLLNPDYLADPLWYIPGLDGFRYPVHFIFYSLLASPIRLIVELFQFNPLTSLRILNTVLLAATFIVLFRWFVRTTFQQIVLTLLVFVSPLVFFLVWPGPDMYYLCLLLIAAFCFGKKHFGWASFLVVLASWHSQPLIILSGGMLLLYFFSETSITRHGLRLHIATSLKAIMLIIALIDLALVPYVYNHIIFGVFTPWTVFQDIRTQIYGFGIQNASVDKFLEMLFDLNIGLFWYAPIICLAAGYYFLLSLKKQLFPISKQQDIEKSETNRGLKILDRITRILTRYVIKPDMILLLFLCATMLFYQTNPAWNYGTSGYGPTRHIIFLLPFFIYFIVSFAKRTRLYVLLLILIVITQLPILGFNGLLAPNFMNSLYHSPYAIWILNTSPQLYNPTPEIFTDRTNHKDVQYPVSAIYKTDGSCKKAYVLYNDVEMVKKECGYIPSQYREKLIDPLSQKSKSWRTVTTSTATFWPDAYTCDYPVDAKDYICMFTLDDVVRFTGVKDKSRFKKVEKYKGVWQLVWGRPIKINIPPGYFLNYYSYDGQYVNY